VTYIGFVLHRSKTVRKTTQKGAVRSRPAARQENSRMANKPKFTEDPPALEEQTAEATGKGFEATAKGFDSTVSGLKEGMSRAAAGFADTQAKVKEGMEKAMKTAEELVTFSQGNLEALVKSGQIWAAGVQDIGKQIAANAQAQFDETMSAFKAISSARSLKDAFDLQAGLARSTLEKTLTESGRLTDASMKLTEQALAPLTARFSLAIEKFAKAA
jgi:phasin family protein